MPRLSITLVKSPTGYRPVARATIKAMGLTRLHQTVQLPDNESIRGMIASVPYMLKVESAVEDPTSQSEKRGPSMVVTSAAPMAATSDVEQVTTVGGRASGTSASRKRSRKPEASSAPEGNASAGQEVTSTPGAKSAPRARRSAAASAATEASQQDLSENADTPQEEVSSEAVSTEDTTSNPESAGKG